MPDTYLVGILYPDTATFDAVPVGHIGLASTAWPILARLWRDTFAHDTTIMITTLMGHPWSWLGIPRSSQPVAGLVPGVGMPASATDLSSPISGSVITPRHPEDWAPPDILFAYLIDPRTDLVAVCSTSQLWPNRVRQHALLRLGVPVRPIPPCGLPDHRDRWGQAPVHLDGLWGTYPARVCTCEHEGGRIVVAFTGAVADRIAADSLAAARADQDHGGPILRRVGDRFDLVHAATTAWAQAYPVPRTADGLHLVGDLVLPWRLAGALTRPEPRPEASPWRQVTVTDDGRVYPAYLREHDTGQPAFTLDVALRVAADSYTRWLATADPFGEFYQPIDAGAGIEHVWRPATPDQRSTTVHPDDGLLRLGGHGRQPWPWSVSHTG